MWRWVIFIQKKIQEKKSEQPLLPVLRPVSTPRRLIYLPIQGSYLYTTRKLNEDNEI